MSLKTAKFWLFCVLSLLAFGVMSDVEAAPITFDYEGRSRQSLIADL